MNQTGHLQNEISSSFVSTLKFVFIEAVISLVKCTWWKVINLKTYITTAIFELNIVKHSCLIFFIRCSVWILVFWALAKTLVYKFMFLTKSPSMNDFHFELLLSVLYKCVQCRNDRILERKNIGRESRGVLAD